MDFQNKIRCCHQNLGTAKKIDIEMKEILNYHRQLRKLDTLVENRTVYGAEFAELNIYETHQKASHVYLQFGFPVIASMLTGKKIMHLEEKASFDFLPGESVVLPANKKMIIDFPEATHENPTQCLALGVDASKIQETIATYKQLTYIKGDEEIPTYLNESAIHLNNDENVQFLVDRLMRTFIGGSVAKDALLDVMIKELIIRLLQTNAKLALLSDANSLFDNNRMAFIVNYIRNHLTEDISVDQLAKKACMSSSHFYKSFKNTLGESPIDYLNAERIKLAKKLLRTTQDKMSDVAHVCGFNSASYFIRSFKKSEGITPIQYRQSLGFI